MAHDGVAGPAQDSGRPRLVWYATGAVAEGWNQNALEHFIKIGLMTQIGAAPTNFDTTLHIWSRIRSWPNGC